MRPSVQPAPEIGGEPPSCAFASSSIRVMVQSNRSRTNPSLASADGCARLKVRC
jgi:hypothetical protein